MLSLHFPALAGNDGNPLDRTVAGAELVTLFTEVVPALEAAGTEVFWPGRS